MKQKVLPALSSFYRKRRDPRIDVSDLARMKIQPIGIWDVNSQSGLKNARSSQIVHYWHPAERLPPGKLLVVRRDPSDPLKAKWVQIGQFENGRLGDIDSRSKLFAGEPIFLSNGIPRALAMGSSEQINVAMRRSD